MSNQEHVEESKEFRVSVFSADSGEWHEVWRGNDLDRACEIADRSVAPSSVAMVPPAEGEVDAKTMHMNQAALGY